MKIEKREREKNLISFFIDWHSFGIEFDGWAIISIIQINDCPSQNDVRIRRTQKHRNEANKFVCHKLHNWHWLFDSNYLRELIFISFCCEVCVIVAQTEQKS